MAFYLGLGSLFTHEIDAIPNHEWRGLPLLLTRGRYSVRGAQAPITRWLPGRLVREAGAAFALDAIHAPAAHGPVAAHRVDPASPPDWPAIAAARYLFLTLRRTESA